MPIWGQFVLGFAAVVGAIIYLWQKLLKPGAQLVTTMDLLLPIAKKLVEYFHDAPEAWATLHDIYVEFHPDSGTTLRDVINRLEQASIENAQATRDALAAAQVLQIDAEASRQLAQQDRILLATLIAKLDLANSKIDDAVDIRDTLASDLKTHLIEEGAGRAAIAADLEASHLRAEAHPESGEPGAAADAAMRRSPDEEG